MRTLKKLPPEEIERGSMVHWSSDMIGFITYVRETLFVFPTEYAWPRVLLS